MYFWQTATDRASGWLLVTGENWIWTATQSSLSEDDYAFKGHSRKKLGRRSRNGQWYMGQASITQELTFRLKLTNSAELTVFVTSVH